MNPTENTNQNNQPTPLSAPPSPAVETSPDTATPLATATAAVPLAPAPADYASAPTEPLLPPAPEQAPAEPAPQPVMPEEPITDAAATTSDEEPTKQPIIVEHAVVMRGPNPLLELLFRFGFASIFLVNAIVAALHPADFLKLLTDNYVAALIGHESTLVKVAMFNDLFLGCLILFGRYKTVVYGWAGGWLLMVAGLKLMNLFIK